MTSEIPTNEFTIDETKFRFEQSPESRGIFLCAMIPDIDNIGQEKRVLKFFLKIHPNGTRQLYEDFTHEYIYNMCDDRRRYYQTKVKAMIEILRLIDEEREIPLIVSIMHILVKDEFVDQVIDKVSSIMES